MTGFTSPCCISDERAKYEHDVTLEVHIIRVYVCMYVYMITNTAGCPAVRSTMYASPGHANLTFANALRDESSGIRAAGTCNNHHSKHISTRRIAVALSATQQLAHQNVEPLAFEALPSHSQLVAVRIGFCTYGKSTGHSKYSVCARSRDHG